MTTHKAIREATEEGPFYTAMVAKDDLRALLADLDAKTAMLESFMSLDRQCLKDIYGSEFISTVDAALKGTP